MFTSINGSYSYTDFFTKKIKEFGGESRGKEKYVLRKNINTPFPDSGAYFGCISEGEEPSGAYSDLSIVVFPSNEANDADDRWFIALGVGSLGFKNDYSLVSLPGTRRMFVNCLSSDAFIKNDFLDIESQDGFSGFCDKNNIPETLRNCIKNYQKVLLACTLFDPNDQTASEKVIRTYLAIYAALRKWPSNNNQRQAVIDATASQRGRLDEQNEINELLNKRKYIVLQGAPGTGKTRMAKALVAGETNVFFTQFHAETSYSDFIYGIVPDVSASELKYAPKEGIFVQAVDAALKKAKSNEKVFLIIDEINRANLSNVLGQAFYLFEPSMSGSGIKVEICPGLSLEKLPDNLYVIATMNTADRSLAVVDFALRRRFAWYTMYPHEITADAGKKFCEEDFNNISSIFERYATDEELNLQPGQAYFIVDNNDTGAEIKRRLKYEVMPLIKEYLANGMLARAKDEFVNYFRERIGEEMYQ